jgi:hypothetical protein
MLNVKVGTYTGNGATSGTRAITGIGFQPKFVFVWSGDTGEIYPVFSIDSAIAGLGACYGYWGENAWVSGNTTVDRFNSFDADGFTIACGSSSSASFKALNKNAVTFYYLALGGSDIYTGNYTGNGSDNRNITGVGFQPELVFLMGGSQHQVYKTSSTGNTTDLGLYCFHYDNPTNTIQALQSDGFQVGTASPVNANSVVYYYMAVKSSADIKSGTFTGNATDNRDITGVGFQPDFVMLKGSSGNNQYPSIRSSDHSGDTAKKYRASGFNANMIQSFISDGFQVGSDSHANGSGVVYHYLAIKTPSGGGGGPTFIPKTVVF